MKTIDIRYNSKTESIELIYPSGEKEVLSDDMPTEPVLSPNKKKAAYISPLEWEMFGNLYVVDLESGEQQVLIEPEDSYIPKNVIWKDDNRLLVLIGCGNGTVTVGGNIYSVNVETKEKVQVTEYESNIQILDFHIENDTLYYEGIRYKNENFSESEPYSNNISLDSLMSY